MEFWELEEHEVPYSWLQAFKIMPRNELLATRRPRSCLQMAPGIQHHAQEWSSGKSKTTKWPTFGSGHSKSCPTGEFWELEDHERAYSWLWAFKIMPRTGVLGTRRPRSALLLAKKNPGFPRHPSGICPNLPGES
eukprot:9027831-Pyramimonas_sp.AAC.1